MATKQITNATSTESVKDSATWLLVQNEELDGVQTRVLRRATTARLVAALRAAGINDGYCTNQAIRDMYPDLVKSVEPTETGILVTYFDDSTQEIPIESGGLAFDEVTFDAETGYLHILLEGEDVVDPCFIGNTGGGGSASATYAITMQNLLDTRTLTVPEGQPAYIRFRYTSVDSDGVDDGPGIGTIMVGGVRAATVNVNQGDNEIDVSSYLASGSNTLKIKVENSDGNSKSITYSITAVALSMKTTLSEFSTNSGEVTFYYTPTGSGTKTIYFKMDGEEIGTAEIATSGRSQRFTIPAQAHGGHVFESYAEMVIGDVTLKSNVIRLGMIWVESGNAAVSIVTTFDKEAAKQGETLTIPYYIHNPASENANVYLKVLNPDGSEYSSAPVTVDRTAQTWTVQDYPIGNVTFRIQVGDVYEDCTVAVESSGIVIEKITDGLVFEFNAAGRSNLEENPAHWETEDGSVVATFDGVGFAGSDGWLTSADGSPMLRLLPGSQMTIPFSLFNVDRRENGVTVEVEMATHNVRDYDSIVLSCRSGGRGFRVASQYAQINSEQSELSMQFKEDERVRVSFVVEPQSLNRLIYIFVDGVMCGTIQYPTDDNFQQNPAVGITIGADSSGIDLFKIMLYDKGLSRNELRVNYIYDRPTLADRINAHTRNDILNENEEIVIEKLPATLPYMIITSAALPQFKGNKLTCDITFVNPADPTKSFTARNAQIDVQGTSSAGYKKKNFKIKLSNGIVLTATNIDSSTYQMSSRSVPTNVFTMKADVASSEGANNVELVTLFNDTVPYTLPAQENDNRVRWGIEGFPMVIFWNNSETGETKFWGKYNFNNDKGTPEVFGLTEGCESWEIKNNTSDRVIFKRSDYTGTDWLNDFEARYPEDNTDYTRLKILTDWIVSTDRDAATNASLGSTVTINGVGYTTDSKEYRLAKFKAEFERHFVKVPMLYYYIFTEVFLMVDNRAKNFFPSTYDGVHWLPLPYDMDTAIGINNEGKLVFDYDLEDTDKVNGANVFNGHNSVLWCNIRDAFPDELKSMYATIRQGGKFSYEEVARRFSAHQTVWPETVWNEDAYEKYLEPLVTDNDSSYLSMLQGNKASQREWWLFNGFRYRDSKYQTGDAESKYITLRCYQVGNITVTPYSHIHPRIKYGSYTVTERGKRNVPTTLVNPLDQMDDTETYIYSADRLAEIGDLSHLQVGYADFSMATKLQKLKIGDGASTYRNTRCTELYVGNNELLSEIDIQNCSVLAQTVDLSGCSGIEIIKAKGSAIPAVTLPIGGKVKTMELPATITNLTIRNQKELSTLTLEGYSNISTLRIENTKNVPLEAIINGSTSLDRVRLINVEWNASNETALATSIAKLKACGGMDAAGGNADKAVVTGRLYVPSISSELMTEIFEAFPELAVIVNGVANYLVRYLNYDNTVLYNYVVSDGGSAINPVETGEIEAPTKPGTEDILYSFVSFGSLPTNIKANCSVIAQYVENYAVRFYGADTEIPLVTEYVIKGGDATEPIEAGRIETPTKESTAQYDYTFSGWDGDFENVTEPRNIYAMFDNGVRSYRVRFLNGDSLIYTQIVEYGGNAIYVGENPSKASTTQYHYTFSGWSRLNGGEADPDALNNIVEDTDIYAAYDVTVRIYYEVKFYNGNTLLQTKTVESGNDAAYTGSTPTKTATAQYTYSFTGWASSDGGYANANILKNITANKNVYAAYSATLRYYTVTFMNGSATLQTVSNVPYGGSATYTGDTPTSPEGDEYEFTGWSPKPTNIQGDTVCKAMFSNPNGLDGKTWAEISEISAAGTGANYFAVGDCKAVALKGTVGTLELDATYYVYILGFNHNSEIEGNGIHFGTFKSAASNGIDLCLVDSKYNSSSTDGTKYFNMNHWGNSNNGGWAGCDMRYDILGSTDKAPSGYGASPASGRAGYDPSATCATTPVANTLMAALPADLRAVMKPMTKYTNNTGASGDTEAKVTVTTDYLPLLAEFEIFGARTNANSYEQNKQKQYDYFVAGNSKKKYRHSATGSTAYWWERSAYYNYSNYFCYVITGGNANNYGANNAYGVAPAFKV